MTPQLYIARTSEGTGFPLPSYSSKYHAGLNLLAGISVPLKINPNERALIPIGFAIGIPQGFCGQIVTHFSLAQKHGIIVSGAPQLLNPANRGPVVVMIQNVSSQAYVLHRGEIVAELLITPAVQVCWDEVKTTQSFSSTETEAVVLDQEELSKDSTPQKNPFESHRRMKFSIRNRYGVPDEDNS